MLMRTVVVDVSQGLSRCQWRRLAAAILVETYKVVFSGLNCRLDYLLLSIAE